MNASIGGMFVEGVKTAAAMLKSRKAYLKFRVRNPALTRPMRLRMKTTGGISNMAPIARIVLVRVAR